MSSSSKDLPLVVDLDGTLIKTDLLLETASRFLIEHPFQFFKLPIWFMQGKLQLKSNLASATHIDPTVLPYNEAVLSWLRAEKSKGRHIVLATASHRALADQVATHLGFFDEVFATDNNVNLRSEAKRDALTTRYGEGGFEYLGNDWADTAVWKAAAKAHVVSNSPALIESVGGNLGQTFSADTPTPLKGLLKAMRPHQWMKNLLVFIPLLAAQRIHSGIDIALVLLAFFTFGLTASSVYLLNDLVDVNDDRHHQSKRKRPFASGNLSLLHGWLAWPLLLLTAFALSAFVLPWMYTASLAVYFVLTSAYSLRLKQLPIVDVLTLAGLYTMRIIAGAAAINVPLSFWLLLLSMFLFLSLAFIKRYSELRAAREAGKSGALRGRGYHGHDLELVSSLGGNAGYIAVLVLALYIQDSHTAVLYASPMFIWLACPLLLFWISRAWLIAHRGHMHDDPIVFAIKDRVSWLVAALFVTTFVLAKTIQ